MSTKKKITVSLC